MRRPNRAQRGFTLIEMVLVATLVGLFAGLAAMRAERSIAIARMGRMASDLAVMRDLIEQYRVDRRVYPESLQSLVDARYLRFIPEDVVTRSSETWIELPCDELRPAEAEREDAADVAPGICDVRSDAAGRDSDGVPWRDY